MSPVDPGTCQKGRLSGPLQMCRIRIYVSASLLANPCTYCSYRSCSRGRLWWSYFRLKKKKEEENSHQATNQTKDVTDSPLVRSLLYCRIFGPWEKFWVPINTQYFQYCLSFKPTPCGKAVRSYICLPPQWQHAETGLWLLGSFVLLRVAASMQNQDHVWFVICHVFLFWCITLMKHFYTSCFSL